MALPRCDTWPHAVKTLIREAGKLTKGYGFNPTAMQQGLWSTDPIWQAHAANGSLTHNDTNWHYLHTDHLGTPQLATTKEGGTSWKAASEAFGAAGLLQSQSAITMNLRFPGQYFDEETGSHYNFYRDHKPNQGRYLQSDPIGLGGGHNVYTYVNSSPLLNFDSMGLVEWSAQTLSASRGLVGLYGAGIDLMRFTSTCKNGKPCIVYNMVVTAGVGIGTPVGVTMDLRGSDYVDQFDEPSPSSIGGPAVKLGCQAVVGRHLGTAMLQLVGHAKAKSSFQGPALSPVGIDINCQAMIGASIVLHSDCDCKDCK